nr:immunoglobulin light chain junction region [Macaca mulatta]
CMQGMEFPVTF